MPVNKLQRFFHERTLRARDHSARFFLLSLFWKMHGSYEHRITCNLHTDDYACLQKAAAESKIRLAPFVVEAALAYVRKGHVVPFWVEHQLQDSFLKIGSDELELHRIVARGNALQRITHDDLIKAHRLAQSAEEHVRVLKNITTFLADTLS